MAKDWKELRVNPGDRILPAWNDLVEKGDHTKIVAGSGTRIRTMPGGGIYVSGNPSRTRLIHPWKIVGALEEDGTLPVREGTIEGKFPWVNEEERMGELNEDTGEMPRVKVTPKSEGFSFIAVGVNLQNTNSPVASLEGAGDSTWDTVRIAEIDKLPGGMGSGGVLADSEGWAWYPVVRMNWEDNLITGQFVIVRHNLGHFVVSGEGNVARHFFPPV